MLLSNQDTNHFGKSKAQLDPKSEFGLKSRTIGDKNV